MLMFTIDALAAIHMCRKQLKCILVQMCGTICIWWEFIVMFLVLSIYNLARLIQRSRMFEAS